MKNRLKAGLQHQRELPYMGQSAGSDTDFARRFQKTKADIHKQLVEALDLTKLEQIAIHAALERCDGNKTKAAQVLGIALKTLYNKLAAEAAGGTARQPPG